jgi:hypothetical protein
LRNKAFLEAEVRVGIKDKQAHSVSIGELRLDALDKRCVSLIRPARTEHRFSRNSVGIPVKVKRLRRAARPAPRTTRIHASLCIHGVVQTIMNAKQIETQVVALAVSNLTSQIVNKKGTSQLQFPRLDHV